MNSKKLFIIVLSVLAFAFTSCKSNQEPTKFKPTDLGGTWQSQAEAGTSFVFDATAGTIAINSIAAVQIQNWDANKNTEATEFSVVLNLDFFGTGTAVNVTFKFTSATDCEVSVTGIDGVEPFKKQ